MSQDYSQGRSIVVETDALDRLALLPFGLALVSLLAAWSILFRWLDVTTSVAGLSVTAWLGVGYAVAGVVLGLVGVLSWTGRIDTTPDPELGMGPSLWYGGFAFVVTALALSQSVGLGAIVWVPISVVVATAIAAGLSLVPEDLGVSIPIGLFDLFVGVVFLTGTIGPEWSWSPGWLSATFVSLIAIATLSFVGALFTVWASGVAVRGFGARGRELGAHSLVTINVVVMLVILGLLLLFIVQKGLDPALKGASLWPPSLPFVTNGFGLQYDVNGIFPAIVGTVWLVVGAVLFATPLGVGAAVFLTEYAEQGRLTALVEIATNGLWSTPSIVYGLFGYAFLVPRLGNTSSLLAGQLVLGFMLLPLVLITSRESLQNVPDDYRDASAALGVGKWETIKSVVLPAAVPGVLTGLILGVGRIAGETAPILLVLTSQPFAAESPHVLSSFHFTAAPPFVANDALLSPATALPYQIFAVITAGVSASESFGWATALVLLVVVLVLYSIGITTRLYFRRRLSQ
ncbi:MAG: phosphate ABC transporter permease PstA [Halapricum sp.]